MGRLWCPNCHAEFVEGWETCSTCGVALVSEKPVETRPVEPPVVRPEPEDEDPFVAIWTGPFIDGEGLCVLLEDSHIPVDRSDAPSPGETVVMVPRSYLSEASAVIGGRAVPWPSAVEVSRDGGFDWKRGVRLALVIVAVGLIILMLIP